MKPETQAACEAAKRALETARAAIFAEAESTVASNEPADLVRFYADMREEYDALGETISEFTRLEKDLSYTRVPACFDVHGIQNVRVAGYGLVGLNRRWSCSILEGKKDDGFAYLRKAGQDGMIIETINAGTLGAWARKEVEDEGVEPPDDIFKTSIARYVSLRRSK